tara:strand:- start:1958 stop:2296 length:339 start_codon:yes stop_codon:yes gene_type:complete
MKLFVLETVRGDQFTFSIETMGIYSTQEKAMEAVEQLPPENHSMVYNISEFKIDAPPHNSWKDYSKEIKNLMDIGVVDQLVGEDGKFYYRLTEKGKKMAEGNHNDLDGYNFN